jgi:outer membrane receptor protein involved in Fe transport
MRTSRFFGATALATTAFFSFASAANAQGVPNQPPAGTPVADEEQGPGDDSIAEGEVAQGDVNEDGTITVTGSRIARPEFTGTLPGVQVDQEQISTRGFTNAIDIINDVPLTGTGASLNGANGTGQPTALGAAFVDLLDLGTQRTLTLVNGRRFVSGNSATLFAFANETGGQVDVNSIPTRLIQRVDVLTVGGAAAYGTDAIAGVINFILRDDYVGTEFTAISNITERGDGFGYNIRGIHGMNFAGDRGNVIFAGEYSRVDAVEGSQREFQATNPIFATNFNNGGIRNPAFTPAIGGTTTPFLSSTLDLAPGSIGAENVGSLLVSPGGSVFEIQGTVPAQNRVGISNATFGQIGTTTQLIPGTVISAAQAGCSLTNLTTFCNFAPSALPTGATQPAFVTAVITRFAPGLVGQGTQAQQNALALSLLQANRPTPREFFAANPNVPVNAFIGAFIPGFVDIANTNTTPVNINGQTVPLNQIFPRIAVPLQFNAAGNVVQYNLDGTVRPDTPAVTGAVPGGGYFDPNTFLVRPQQDRYLANLIGHFDLTENITFFTENLYARVRAVTPYAIASANVPSTTAAETFALALNVNNPYLDDADRAALATYGITPANRNGNFIFARTNQDILGNNPNTNTNETYRFVNGLRGDFGLLGHKQRWEISGTYGRSDLRTTGQSLRDVEFALAVDTVRDASGQIRCRSQVDPTAANNLQGIAPNIIREVVNGQLVERVFTPVATPDLVAACQPLNPFGFNQMSQAAKDYVTASFVTKNRSEQVFAQAIVNGSLFDLPGGEFGYAVTGEYRKENLSIRQNEVGQLGRGRNAPTAPTNGEIRTLEGGLEFRIPIFGDDFKIPLFRNLELNPAIRFTKQSGEAPSFTNIAGTLVEPKMDGKWEKIYSLAGTWRPISDVLFRGNYTRSIRQPGIVELFLSNQSSFAAPLDPCGNANIGGSTNPARRQANCAAAVVAAGLAPDTAAATAFLNTFVSQTSSLPGVFAGNSNLRPEKGKSWTVGGVLSPRFIPRLSLSADYINLELKDQITPVTVAQALSFCFDSPTFPDTTPQFGSNACTFFTRDANFQVAAGFASGYLNLTATKLEGINFSALYSFNLPSDLGNVSLRGNLFHLKRYTTSNSGDFSVDFSESAGTFNRPKWESVSSARYQQKEFYTQLTWRWRDETFIFSGGAPATIEVANFVAYPETHFFDLALGFELESGFNMQLAVTNLTDKTFAGLAGRYNGGYFDQLGRRFQVTVGLEF